MIDAPLGTPLLYQQFDSGLKILNQEGTEVGEIPFEDCSEILEWISKGFFFSVKKDSENRETFTTNLLIGTVEQDVYDITVEFDPIQSPLKSIKRGTKKVVNIFA